MDQGDIQAAFSQSLKEYLASWLDAEAKLKSELATLAQREAKLKDTLKGLREGLLWDASKTKGILKAVREIADNGQQTAEVNTALKELRRQITHRRGMKALVERIGQGVIASNNLRQLIANDKKGDCTSVRNRLGKVVDKMAEDSDTLVRSMKAYDMDTDAVELAVAEFQQAVNTMHEGLLLKHMDPVPFDVEARKQKVESRINHMLTRSAQR